MGRKWSVLEAFLKLILECVWLCGWENGKFVERDRGFSGRLAGDDDALLARREAVRRG